METETQGSAVESGSTETGQATEASSQASQAAQTESAALKEAAPKELTGLDRLRELSKNPEDPKTGKLLPKTAKKAEKPADAAAVADPSKVTEVDGKIVENPAFKPNLKFKVMDKEHDVPELLQSVMKDADSEKMVRELLEKAYGLDVVKPRFIKEREEHQKTQQAFGQVRGNIDQAVKLYARNDMEAFFKHIGVEEQKVLQWVVDKLNYNELPPDQRKVLDDRKSAEARALQAEQQVVDLRTDYEKEAVQVRGLQLQTVLDRPEISAIAQVYESAAGMKPGAFRTAVAEIGDLVWQTSKIDLTPEQAVQEVIRRYRLQAPAAAPAATSAAPAAPAQATAPTAAVVPAALPKTPVIPNLAGSSTSPMKSKPRSLADLRKIAAELQ